MDLGMSLTDHVDALLAGHPDPRVELAHDELVLARLPDVLHQPAVVEVGAVEADAVGLLHGDGALAEGLHHLPGPLAPVAGAHRRHGEGERHHVEGDGQVGSSLPGDLHGREAALWISALAGSSASPDLRLFPRFPGCTLWRTVSPSPRPPHCTASQFSFRWSLSYFSTFPSLSLSQPPFCSPSYSLWGERCVCVCVCVCVSLSLIHAVKT